MRCKKAVIMSREPIAGDRFSSQLCLIVCGNTNKWLRLSQGNDFIHHWVACYLKIREYKWIVFSVCNDLCKTKQEKLIRKVEKKYTTAYTCKTPPPKQYRNWGHECCKTLIIKYTGPTIHLSQINLRSRSDPDPAAINSRTASILIQLSGIDLTLCLFTPIWMLLYYMILFKARVIF